MKGVFFTSRQEGALFLATILWGGTFIIVHEAVRTSPPFFFVGFRFMLASLVVGLLLRGELLKLTGREIFAGTLIGLGLAGGYGLQTVGLISLSSSMSAFILAIYVPMVPLLQWGFMRRRPQAGNWLAIFLCFIGLGLLANPDPATFTFSSGEMVTILAAAGVAVEIILVGYFAPGLDVRRLTFFQLLAASLAAFAIMPVRGESLPAFSPIWLGAAIFMAFATTLIQLAMNWAQKSVSPTRATVIYASEPVWAGLIGWMVGESFTSLSLAGAGLVFFGLLVCELFPARPMIQTPPLEENNKKS